MKRAVLGSACLLVSGALISLCGAAPASQAANYKIDPVHSAVVFRCQHLGVSYAYGVFNDISGSFTFDEANPANSRCQVEIKTESIDTNNAKRDQHLKGPDFFDAKRYPTLKFVSTSVEKAGDKYTLTGDLTMHGVTKRVTAPMEYVGSAKDPWGGFRCGFEVMFTVKRSDFEMKNMIGPVGDEVRVIVSIEGIKE
jgi:polyisoprenoid-binding protein YceI